MSSAHCVVVWEYQSDGQWLPHTPGVARTLERAHDKKLTRVVLADADPALKGHYVNLRTLTQSFDTPDGGTVECPVRRQCYSVTSAGGRGARWEWARLASPPLPAELHYEPMPMEAQCLVEQAWRAGGAQVWWGGWRVCVPRGTARRGGRLRILRRRLTAPYPRAPPHCSHPVPGRGPRIPHQHTGSSEHSVQSNLSAHSNLSTHSNLSDHSSESSHSAPSTTCRSASPKDRKPGLARQILHNLNIFSHSKPPLPAPPAAAPPAASPPAAVPPAPPAARRHSVDTVSTYLSHESKDSLQHGSVGELLDCSGGSDDVFETAPAELPHEHRQGGERSPEPPCAEWSEPARERAAPPRGLQESQCTWCHACGARRSPPPPALPAPPSPPSPPSPPAPPAGPQPPGTMAWRLHHTPLPQHDAQTSILVTYNFQSGVQGPEDPCPGTPYYAVGFPRHSLLPDNPLGRQVLWLSRAAWERRVLFCVRPSATTGREHVVCWARAPPPAPAAPPAALLRAARDLRRLLRPHPH